MSERIPYDSPNSSVDKKKNLAAVALAAGALVASESVQAQGEYPLTAQEYAEATQAKAAKVVSTPKELAEFFAHGGVAHFDSNAPQPYIGAGVNASNVAANVQTTLDGRHAVAAVGAYTDNNAGAAVRVGYGKEWTYKGVNIEWMVGGENLSVVAGRQVTFGGEYNKVADDYVGAEARFPLSNNVRGTASITRHRVDNGPQTKYHNQGTLGLEGRWSNWVYGSAKVSKTFGGNNATSSEVRVGVQRGPTNVYWYVNKQPETSSVIGIGVSHALGGKNSEEANSLPKWDTNPYAQYVYNTNVADAPHGMRNYLENYGVKKYQPNTQTTQPNTPSTPNKPTIQPLDLNSLPNRIDTPDYLSSVVDFPVPEWWDVKVIKMYDGQMNVLPHVKISYKNGKLHIDNPIGVGGWVATFEFTHPQTKEKYIKEVSFIFLSL